MKLPARRLDERGIALAHVLMLGVVLTAVALGLTMMMLQRFTGTARRTESNTKTAITAGTAARLTSGWNTNMAYCSSFNDADGSCGCSRAGCGCTCTCTVGGDSTQTSSAEGSCNVTAPSCDQCTITVHSQE